jgi:2-dehydropantoate 2-reductase
MRDGITNYDPSMGCIHYGEKKNAVISRRVADIRDLFDRCGIAYEIDEDMLHGLWFKYMCNVGENMTCALLGIPFGTYCTNEESNVIRRAAMWEVAAIAQKKGIDLGEKEIEQQERIIEHLPPANKPSTLQDLERGRKTEVEMFSGTVLRLGQELGIATPVNQVLYSGIKVLEEKYECK